MPQRRSTDLEDLGQDLLGHVFERLPVQDRAQLESVSKIWRDLSNRTAWMHVSYSPDTKEKLLAFLDWLYSHVGNRRPEAVRTIQLRGSGLEFYDWDRLTCFRNVLKLELGDSHKSGFSGMAVKPATLAALRTLSLLEEFVLAYKPSDFNDALDDDMDERDLNRVLTLETFADFRHLRLLDITFVNLACDSYEPTWSLELHPRFAGLALDTLRLSHVSEVLRNSTLETVLHSLKVLELQNILRPFPKVEIEAASLETLVYGRDVPVDNPDWHNRPFPFKGAKQLRRLLWHGTDIESLSQALPKCPHVTNMKFSISSYYEDWTIERLQTWPTYTTLRQLEMDTVVIGNEIGWSCLLLPFARFSSLERLNLKLGASQRREGGKLPLRLATAGMLKKLHTLILMDTRFPSTWTVDFGSSGLQHLQSLRALHLRANAVSGALVSTSLEILKVDCAALLPSETARTLLFSHLPRLRTLHLKCNFTGPEPLSGVLLLSQALGNLRALKEIVLLRQGKGADLGLVEMALNALSNTQILYDHIVLEDQASEAVLSRIPSAKLVEIQCKHAQLDPLSSPSTDFLSAFLDLRLSDLWHPATNDMIQLLDACSDTIMLRQPLLHDSTSVSGSHFEHIQFENPLLKSQYGGGCRLPRREVSRFWVFDQEVPSDQT